MTRILEQSKTSLNRDYQTSLNINNDLVYLRIVQSFVVETALIAGFDAEDSNKFRLISEEAFVYVMNTSFDENETGKITITSRIENNRFVISFFDKGLPFSELSRSGLELNILKYNSDGIEWINHGKNGKEFRIIFHRPEKDITQYEQIGENQEIVPSEDIEIRRMKNGEEEQISQIVYRSYGYTYPNEDMYYPERIKKMNGNGDIISIVVFDKNNGNIAGHCALEKYLSDSIMEIGQAVVMPQYRGRGLLKEMSNMLEKEGASSGLKGIFGEAVTSHIRSQKTILKHGYTARGINFGLLPKDMDFKKLKTHSVNQRESCLVFIKMLEHKERTISDCGRHNDIIERIYKNIGINMTIGTDNTIDDKSLIYSNYKNLCGVGTINVSSAGKDYRIRFKSEFNRLRMTTNAEVIFLNIAIIGPFVKELIEFVEKMGFFFTGILPYGLDKNDIVTFVYLNSIIDTNMMEIYGEFANKIFDYSIKEMNRIMN